MSIMIFLHTYCQNIFQKCRKYLHCLLCLNVLSSSHLYITCHIIFNTFLKNKSNIPRLLCSKFFDYYCVCNYMFMVCFVRWYLYNYICSLFVMNTFSYLRLTYLITVVPFNFVLFHLFEAAKTGRSDFKYFWVTLCMIQYMDSV